MKIEKVNPDLLKKIVDTFHGKFEKPRLVKENIQFSITDKGKSINYEMNTNHPHFALMEAGREILGDDKTLDEYVSYNQRINAALCFIGKNKDQLEKLELYKKTKTHALISIQIYEAAAVCRLSPSGFRFKDMIKTIKSL